MRKVNFRGLLSSKGLIYPLYSFTQDNYFEILCKSAYNSTKQAILVKCFFCIYCKNQMYIWRACKICLLINFKCKQIAMEVITPNVIVMYENLVYYKFILLALKIESSNLR